jgi:hypothetical protein
MAALIISFIGFSLASGDFSEINLTSSQRGSNMCARRYFPALGRATRFCDFLTPYNFSSPVHDDVVPTEWVLVIMIAGIQTVRPPT